MSGYVFLFQVRPRLRIGVETLVSNSDQNARTTMNYQAAGPVVELTYGDSWFVSDSAHAGGVIVNAMANDGPAAAAGATSGTFFKGNGLFVAPSIDVGYRFRIGEVSLFVKHVHLFGEKERGGSRIQLHVRRAAVRRRLVERWINPRLIAQSRVRWPETPTF
jgi:hypothetical protein